MDQRRQKRRGIVDRKIVELLRSKIPIRQITKSMKVGKARVRKLRSLAEIKGFLNLEHPLPPFPSALFDEMLQNNSSRPSDVDTLLATYLDWINSRFTAGWHAISIFEQLPCGEKVTRSSFYRFLKRHDLYPDHKKPSRVVPEIVHRPGEALQVDWGKMLSIVCPVTGKKLTVWAFVGVLGFSRYRMVRFTIKLDTETTISLIESMLAEIGGVPTKITSDNPKVFALKACKYEPLINPAYERMASFYGFTVECLPPRDPTKKGKVERPMPYVRRLMEPFEGDWQDLVKAQDFINAQLVLANDKRHGSTGEKPIQRLVLEEVDALSPLPKIPWPREQCHEGTVRKDGHIRFRGKYYSTSEDYIGQELTVIGNTEFVWLYHQGKLIETHQRCLDRFKSKETKTEHLKPWERAMQEASVYRDKARRIGANVEEMVVKMIGNGMGFIDFRKVWGLLSLDKSYLPDQINAACKAAIERNQISYRAVRSELEFSKNLVVAQDPKTPIPLDAPSHQVATRINKYVRDLSEYCDVVSQSSIVH